MLSNEEKKLRAKARSKAWRAANPWYEKERTALRVAARNAKRLADPSWAKEHDSQQYAKYREYQRAYKAANREARNAIYRDWYHNRRSEESQAKQVAKRQRRRGLEQNADGTFTEQDIIEKHKLQRRRCYWCRKPYGKRFHADHVIPLAKGGTNDKGNIVLACASCNLSKRDKLPSEFAGVLL